MTDAQEQQVARGPRSAHPSSDPRAVRTRARLLEAISTISGTDEPITVASLCRVAGVSRASFYAHYADIDEFASVLLRTMIAELVDRFLSSIGPRREMLYQVNLALAAELTEHYALYHAVAMLPISKDGYLSNVRFMASQLERVIEDMPEAHPIPATARFIASAGYGLIDAWLMGDVEMTPEQFADRMTAVLPDWYFAPASTDTASQPTR